MVAARQSITQVFHLSRTSPYICGSCRHQLSQAGTPILQQRFTSSTVSSLPEKSHRSVSPVRSAFSPRDSHGPSTLFMSRQFHSQNAKQAPRSRRKVTRIDALRSAENEVASTPIKDPNQEYVPAETWEGLEFVGSTGAWKEMPVRPQDQFTSWLTTPAGAAQDRTQLVSCLHQALVECLTCAQVGLDPSSTHHLESAQLDQNVMDAIATATFSPATSDQSLEVRFASEAHANAVVEVLTAVDSALDVNAPDLAAELNQSGGANAASHVSQTPEAAVHSSQTIRPQYVVKDELFLNNGLQMEDPITFNILKRFTQLSGHRIPDPVLNTMLSSNKPLSFLIERVDHLVLRPKPKELAKVLLDKPGLSDRSNVLIFPRRETPVDKEKEVGRWKVIERELKERNLPVLGRLKAF